MAMIPALLCLLALVIVSCPAKSSRLASNDVNQVLVQDHVRTHANDTFRGPAGYLPFPYLVPAGPYDQVNYIPNII